MSVCTAKVSECQQIAHIKVSGPCINITVSLASLFTTGCSVMLHASGVETDLF